MTRVLFADNPLSPRSWSDVETDDPAEAIRHHFGTAHLPATTRIYDLGGIGDPVRALLFAREGGLIHRDVTPRDETGVDRLRRIDGPLVVATAPATPLAILIGTLIAVIAITAAVFLLMPKVPRPGSDRYESPNNSLSQRSNQPRVLQRIADIFGTVRSIPDLVAVPYRTFRDHEEVETSLMCIGRGTYEVSDLRDGDTKMVEIAGSSATIYGPYTSPNTGWGTAQEVIGTEIDDPVYSVIKMNEVNGQLLRPPNANQVVGDENIRFHAPDEIQTSGGVDFTEFFAADDEITVSKANFGANATYSYSTESVRLYPDMTVEFAAADPSTLFALDQQVTMTGAVFTGDDGLGGIITLDLSGTYWVDSFPTSSKMILRTTA